MTLPEDENFQNENQPQPGNPDESSLSSGNKAADQADDQSEAESVENAPDGDYPRMDDAVEAFRRELDAIQPPTLDNLSDEPVITPVVQVSRRRRRPSPLNERGTASELGARLESIVQRASPSFDFFVFSLLCGCILAAGYILDSPAILLIGILVAPLFSPWVGASLSTATGEFRLFRQTFGGMLISLTLVFATGALGGFISRLFQPLTFSQAFFHARLWWPDLLMLVLGSLILVITFIQSDEKPVIPSIMVAYEMFLPVS